MQNFHHTYIKDKYDNRAEMLLTDADSLMYEIEAENVYEYLYKNNELFDFSNYPENLKNSNNLGVGKTKDETYGVPIKDFVELKSKIYIFITEDIYESKKENALIKTLLMMNWIYKNYKNVLFDRSRMRHEMNEIQSKYHNMESYRINESFLACYDNKTYTFEDGYSSLSHIHKSTL